MSIEEEIAMYLIRSYQFQDTPDNFLIQCVKEGLEDDLIVPSKVEYEIIDRTIERRLPEALLSPYAIIRKRAQSILQSKK